MRIIDLLVEASIFTRPGYKYGHKVRAKGDLATAINQKVAGYTPDEDLEWVARPEGTATTVQLGKGTNSYYFKRPDNKGFINLTGSVSTLQKNLTHAPGQPGSTYKNKGDIAEPILSAAVVAKLIKRGANQIGDVNSADLKAVLTQAITQNSVKFTVQDKNSRIADTIQFKMSLKTPTQNFIQSEDFWEFGKDLINGAIDYANGGQLDRYADYFYKNGKVDLITVVSDGLSEQRKRKTDIKAYVTYPNGSQKELEFLNISLKAGSQFIGQVGGGYADDPFSQSIEDPTTKKVKGKTGSFTAAEKLFSPLGVNLTKPTGKIKDISNFWNKIYKESFNQIYTELAGQDIRSEAGFIKKLADMITSHATLGDSKIKLISLNRGGVSQVHSFKDLFNKIKDENINLTVDLKVGRSRLMDSPRPKLSIYDKNTKEELINIRFASTDDESKVWNTIEMGPLLKSLTVIPYSKPKTVSTSTAVTTQQPSTDINRLQNLAGVNQSQTDSTTPGIRNMNALPNAPKEPMGSTFS